VTAARLLVRTPGFIAVDKPPGALVIPGRTAGREPSLREQLEEELHQKLYVVHRLDRDTSGVLIFALNAASHALLSIAFERGAVEKHYLALVRGALAAPVEIDVALAPARRGRMRRARTGERGKSAVTRVRPLELFPQATLVDAQPLTGRTHQIRVHLLEAGHPLLVDPQYGQPAALAASGLGAPSGAVVLARTPLHAQSLAIPSLPGIEGCFIESAMPPDLAGVLELLRSSSGAYAERVR
jgi:tRNA pseudouridine32 synthase/23S rRNA pseudouridine746 synthase/23S rRNA pseudouridine955/2504/2580 synthase